ncbi:protein tyrosine kinase, partial [Haematococcus lacustris]
MAPEMLTGGPVTPAVDIFAFGVLMAEMVLGPGLVYLGHSPQDIMAQVAAGSMRPQLPALTFTAY